MSNLKDRQLTIPEQINQDYRKYALYVIQSRGIPNFYDCLTPVQRLILQKAPTTSDKTIGVVGEVFKTKLYHHGDCLGPETNILLGDGTYINIRDWYNKYPNAELIVKCFDTELSAETISVGHSPRIGQITDEIYEIELENGEIFRCTSNHPFLVKNKGWIKAEDLSEDDSIINVK